jgi:predicted nucleotide-binding protein
LVRKSSTPPPPKESRTYTSRAEIDQCIERVERRISDFQESLISANFDRDAAIALVKTMQSTLRDALGANSPEFCPFAEWDIYDGAMYWGDNGMNEYERQQVVQEGYRKGINRTITELKEVVRHLREKQEFLPEASASYGEINLTVMTQQSSKVFIVHGHDSSAKNAVARFVNHLGLQAIILSEQAAGSNTIIEQMEQQSDDLGYAIVLLTPDDVGRSAKSDPAAEQFRARQNVILELGYFMGKLGRNKVCGLYKGKIELPTDYSGIVYLRMSDDDDDSWKLSLARNLKKAGLAIDSDKLL